MTTALIAQPDSAVLDEFIGHMIGDLGATVSAGLVVIGDRLGLYKALADGEPVTPERLASRTGTAIAYVRPWLANQAAGGYLSYQPESGTFSLSPEQAAALAIEDSPAFFAGAMQLVLGRAARRRTHRARLPYRRRFRLARARPQPVRGHRTILPAGLRHQLGGELATRAWTASSTSSTAGATVVDVGCGHGSSTILMAQAFPASTFVGTDYHEGSIRVARRRAAEAGALGQRLASRLRMRANWHPTHTTWSPCSTACTTWATRPASPARSAQHCGKTAPCCSSNHLRMIGLRKISTPSAGSSTARQPSSAHPAHSLSPERERLDRRPVRPSSPTLLRDAGFSRVRVASQSPVNLIFEARP